MIVIALGVAMLVVGVTVSGLLYDPGSNGGPGQPDTGRTPTSTDNYFIVASDSTILGQAMITLGALAIWAAVSWRILRSSDA